MHCTTSQIMSVHPYTHPQHSLRSNLTCYLSTNVANSPAGSVMARSLSRLSFSDLHGLSMSCDVVVQWTICFTCTFKNIMEAFNLALWTTSQATVNCGPESSWTMSFLHAELSVAEEWVPHYHVQVSRPLYVYSSGIKLKTCSVIQKWQWLLAWLFTGGTSAWRRMKAGILAMVECPSYMICAQRWFCTTKANQLSFCGAESKPILIAKSSQ